MRLSRAEIVDIATAAAHEAAEEVRKNPESLCEGYEDHFEHRLHQLLDRAELVAGLEKMR